MVDDFCFCSPLPNPTVKSLCGHLLGLEGWLLRLVNSRGEGHSFPPGPHSIQTHILIHLTDKNKNKPANKPESAGLVYTNSFPGRATACVGWWLVLGMLFTATSKPKRGRMVISWFLPYAKGSLAEKLTAYCLVAFLLLLLFNTLYPHCISQMVFHQHLFSSLAHWTCSPVLSTAPSTLGVWMNEWMQNLTFHVLLCPGGYSVSSLRIEAISRALCTGPATEGDGSSLLAPS